MHHNHRDQLNHREYALERKSVDDGLSHDVKASLGEARLMEDSGGTMRGNREVHSLSDTKYDQTTARVILTLPLDL